jgi:hypothetical protein
MADRTTMTEMGSFTDNLQRLADLLFSGIIRVINITMKLNRE